MRYEAPPGHAAVNLIVSGIGQRLGAILPRPDQRDTASVLAIAGPVLLAATAGRTVAGRWVSCLLRQPAGLPGTNRSASCDW